MADLEVFFDGLCPLCRREIEMLRRWDQNHQILFTDIAATEFDAESATGLSIETLMREIHGRTLPVNQSEPSESENWIIGVDVFREIYGRLGFSKAVWFSRAPGIAWLLRRGYQIFAYFRFRSAMKRMTNGQLCDATCQSSNTPEATS